MSNRIILVQNNHDEVVVDKIPNIQFDFHGDNNVVKIHETVRVQNNLKFVLGSNCVVHLDEGANCVNSYVDINANNITLHIGKKVCFNNLQLFAAGEPNIAISIGDRTIFAIDVIIRANDRHTIYDLTTREPINRPKSGIHIGAHVWIGQDVFIMKDAHIPNDCIVGARSLITGRADFSPHSVIAGSPARSIRTNVNWDIRTIDQYENENPKIFSSYENCKNSKNISKLDLKPESEYTNTTLADAIASKRLKSNAFFISTPKTKFEALFVPNDKKTFKTLYVFLSAGGRSKSDTVFNCWSWCTYLDGDLLCIEDPTYKNLLHNKNRTLTGWYFGDETNCYLNEISDIINSIKSRVSYKEIIFSGTSAGGYAALFLADKIPNSTAIVGNPQIILPKWYQYEYYKEIHKYQNNDTLGRFDISRIKENQKSKFLILFNYCNKGDRDQILHLASAIQPGVTKINNILLLGLNSYFRPGHNVIYSKEEFPNFVLLSRLLDTNLSLENNFSATNLARHLVDSTQTRHNFLYATDIGKLAIRINNFLVSEKGYELLLNVTNDHINLYFDQFGIKYRYDFFY